MRWLVLGLASVVACRRDAPVEQQAPAPAPHAEVPVAPIHTEQVDTIDARLAGCRDDAAQLIYILDDEGTLSSFDPRKPAEHAIHQIGLLPCGKYQSELDAIAVARTGIAWIVTRNGEVLNTSIHDASCGHAATIASIHDPQAIGLGFVGDGHDGEQLYAAMSDRLEVFDAARDFTRTTKLHHDLGAIPDLTGTNDGKLYAFVAKHEPPFVQQIDPHTAKPIGKRLPLPIASDKVFAWSVAAWGGRLYVFVTTADRDHDPVSSVAALDPATGEYRTIIEHLPRPIRAAGSSTCAPGSGAPTP